MLAHIVSFPDGFLSFCGGVGTQRDASIRLRHHRQRDRGAELCAEGGALGERGHHYEEGEGGDEYGVGAGRDCGGDG